MMDDRNGMGPQGGYIGRITNDAREDEMEENVGQVCKILINLRVTILLLSFIRLFTILLLSSLKIKVNVK